jgi:CrcB protein
VSGSFLIGFLAGRSNAADGTADFGKWHFWTTGVCGGYTTFSTFSWQVLELFRQGAAQEAALYAAGSVGFGLLAVWLGFSLAMKKPFPELRETSESSQ